MCLLYKRGNNNFFFLVCTHTKQCNSNLVRGSLISSWDYLVTHAKDLLIPPYVFPFFFLPLASLNHHANRGPPIVSSIADLHIPLTVCVCYYTVRPTRESRAFICPFSQKSFLEVVCQTALCPHGPRARLSADMYLHYNSLRVWHVRISRLLFALFFFVKLLTYIYCYVCVYVLLKLLFLVRDFSLFNLHSLIY